MYTDKLDLHGQTWHEALPAFIDFYNDAVRRPGGGSGLRLEIVHGYGSTGVGGVLRTRLRKFLESQSDKLTFTPGEHFDGNHGHTVVVPQTPLPDTVSLLAEDILEFCATGKSQSKIVGKFRRHGQPSVLEAIRSLESQKRLRPAVVEPPVWR